MSDRVVMWDFDGTLATRPGLWSTCVLEVLDEHAPGHRASRDELRAALRDGFPWHRADEAHLELCEPDAWWAALDPSLSRAFDVAGVDAAQHVDLARAVRTRFVDGTVGWVLFDDTRPALQATADAGWRNVILSNHVPELPALVAALGLEDLVESVFTSAVIGYDSRTPRRFATRCAPAVTRRAAGWWATIRSPTSPAPRHWAYRRCSSGPRAENPTPWPQLSS
jgi:putative hydrolase of the HAD superfamily